jgi:hypothetical protein
MHLHTWKVALTLGTILTCGAVGSFSGQPDKVSKSQANAQAVAQGSVQAVAFAAKVHVQQEMALANWKLVVVTPPQQYETAHLLLYSTLPAKQLRESSERLEKAHTQASKALEITGEAPWPGKLAVFLFPDPDHFERFVRLIEKRRPDEDDVGSFKVKGEFPHVAATPTPKGKHGPTLEGQAAEQLAAALLTKKVNAPLPDWLVTGFGRATFWRSGPAKELTGYQKYAATVIRKTKKNAMDIWGGTLNAEEAYWLRPSLMDYLAYGKASNRFLAFLKGFQPGENMAAKTTDDALKAANIVPANLDKAWQKSLGIK